MRVSQHKVWNKVNDEVSAGRIIKPLTCTRCNKKLQSTRNIIGHHNDYTKPLDIYWVCQKCHKELHTGLGDVRVADGIKLDNALDEAWSLL